jgi:hypothetical protein
MKNLHIYLNEYRVQSPTSSEEFYEYQTALSTGFYSLVDSGICWDICLKTSQGRLET